MILTIEFEKETDGRWIADVCELPGVTVYGDTHAQAMANAQVLALEVLADQIEHGERDPNTLLKIEFVERAA